MVNRLQQAFRAGKESTVRLQQSIAMALLAMVLLSASADARYDDDSDCEQLPGRDRGPDVLLSLKHIPPPLRSRLSSRKVTWIDIERKEQSSHSNDLGDEVILFLKRYGVRLCRAGG